MTSKDFIKFKMSSLVKEIKSLKASYSFHELSSTHSIEITPNEIYHSNEALKTWEGDFIMEFIQKFPEESLCILTDNSILPIENIEFSIVGKDFKNPALNYLSNINFSSHVFDNQFYDTLEGIFDTYTPVILEEMTYSQEIIDVNTLPSAFTVLENIIDKNKKSINQSNNENLDCENIYPLAA